MKIDPHDVSRVLAEWLVQQRWYAGKSRAGSVSATLLATLSEGRQSVQLWVAEVRYADGVEYYQVPIVLRAEPAEHLEHALIGSVVDSDGDGGSDHAVGTIELYDALHDKDVTQLWLDAFAAESAEAGESALDGVRFNRRVERSRIPVGEPSLVTTAEQSNTSLVYGDAAIMKVFRRLEPGLNPDIEIHAALAELGGAHVAELFGHVSAEFDGRQWSLAMLQEFMTTATDGWELAKISVRDLMAEADLHAEEAGGDFAAEAYRLGVATAEVHANLAAAFPTSSLPAAEISARAGTMNARLDAALYEVPELSEVEPGLRQAYHDLADLDGPVFAQRVHGDLHLGQVLRTVHRWILIDFEGEPAKTIEERRTAYSPLRDVAGMLRSFDYAARHQLIEAGSTPQSEFRASEWAERNRDAFCAGYASTGGLDPDKHPVLLRALEADKAVYEAVYEARNRPRWLSIPLASLRRLAHRA